MNIRLSAILYGILHGIEVAVRNAEHRALTESYGAPDWYDRPPYPAFGVPQTGCAGPSWHEYAPLSQYWRDQVEKAKSQPGVGKNPGKVVAELTFGFWVDLTKNSNHMSLWMDRNLRSAFPNARRLDRRMIHARLKALQLLRNRISHHEPVMTSSNHLYNGEALLSLNDLLECVTWVCRDTAHWLSAEFGYADATQILRRVSHMRVTL